MFSIQEQCSWKINKLNLTFLFPPFRSNIENIDTKMYLDGF